MKKLLVILLFIPLLNYGQIAQDKIDHFVAGAVVSTFTYIAVAEITHDKKKAFWYSLLTAIAAGKIKEEIDKSKGAKSDNADWFATSLGGFTVSMTFQIIPKNKQKPFIY